MTSEQRMCSACGQSFSFQYEGSRMRVCESCRSVMKRFGDTPRDVEKAPEIIDTGSPLELGSRSKVQGKQFDIAGRLQLESSGGGVWDEWYACGNGVWGWVAEAQGQWYCLFEQDIKDTSGLPGFDDVEVGDTLQVPGVEETLTIVEKGTAEIVSGEGEIPWEFQLGETYSYADVSGPNGIFGTLDYSESPPAVFLGTKVSLDDFTGANLERIYKPKKEVLQLHCPECSAPLTIHVPKETARIGCGQCRKLLNLRGKELRATSKKIGRDFNPVLEFGSTGMLPEGEMTVVGCLQRSVTYDFTDYYWQEYLLHSPELGYRWLVCSDDHWSYVKPIAAGDVAAYADSLAEHEGKTYRPFQIATAKVRTVLGEIYWKVEPGDEVGTADFIRPPFMLSRETENENGKAKEITWSQGEYMPVHEVERIFGVEGLHRPITVGPHQPFSHWQVYWYWLLLSAAALILLGLHIAMAPRRVVLDKRYSWDTTESKQFFTDKFELHARQNLRFSASGGHGAVYVLVNGELVNAESKPVRTFGTILGESDRNQEIYLSSVPAGTYTMRLTMAKKTTSTGAVAVNVKLEQGVPRPNVFFIVLAVLAVIPVLTLVYHIYFVSQRWKDSDFGWSSE